MKIYMEINRINYIYMEYGNINYIMHVVIYHSSPLQGSIPVCDDTIVNLLIQLLMDIWGVSSFQLTQVGLLWIFLYMFIGEHM